MWFNDVWQTIGGIVCIVLGAPCALFAAWSLWQWVSMIGEGDGAFGFCAMFKGIAFIFMTVSGLAAAALFTLAYLALK